MHLTIRRAGFGALVASPRFSPPRAFPLSTESRLATSSLGRPGPFSLGISLFLFFSFTRLFAHSFLRSRLLSRAYRTHADTLLFVFGARGPARFGNCTRFAASYPPV